MTSFSKLEKHDIEYQERKKEQRIEKQKQAKAHKKSIRETNANIKKYTNWSNLCNLMKFM